MVWSCQGSCEPRWFWTVVIWRLPEGSTLPHAPPSSRAPSPSVGFCSLSGGHTFFSGLGVGRTFLSWGDVALVVKFQWWPRGNQTPQLPVTEPGWTDLAWCGLSQLSGFSQTSPNLPSASELLVHQAGTPRLDALDTLSQGWATRGFGDPVRC